MLSRDDPEKDLIIAVRQVNVFNVQQILLSHANELENLNLALGEAVTPAISHNVTSSERLAIVEALLKAGASSNVEVNYREENLYPIEKALHVSGMTNPDDPKIRAYQVELVDLLINYGADIFIVASELVERVVIKNAKLLELFLKAGLSVDARTIPSSLLERAIVYSKLVGADNMAESAILLINKGANYRVNLIDHYGCKTPLIKDIRRPDILLALIAKDEDVLNQFTLFDYVILSSEEFMLKLLHRGHHINTPNESGCTPLMHAITQERVMAVALFIELGADLNCQDHTGNTALHYAFALASKKNYFKPFHYSIISMLYTAGAKRLPNKHGVTPLMLGKKSDDLHRLGLTRFAEFESRHSLLPHIANMSFLNSYFKPLRQIIIKSEFIIALEVNNLVKVRSLLDAHPELDVNDCFDEKGYRPISVFIRGAIFWQIPFSEYRHMLTLLVRRGADVNMPNHNNQGPLLECMHHDEIDIKLMLLLIELGVYCDVTNKDYEHLLRHAAFKPHILALEWLCHYCEEGSAYIINTCGYRKNTVMYPHLAQFLLDTSHPIDMALKELTSSENINLILYAFKHQIFFYAHHSNQIIPFLVVFEGLIQFHRLSAYQHRQWRFLSNLQKEAAVRAPAHVDPIEIHRFSRLLESLYEAMGDINKAIAGAASGFKDTGALQSLGLWRCKQNPNPVIAAVAQRGFDRCAGLVPRIK